MANTIRKDRIAQLVSRLTDYDVYGPVEEDGVFLYRRVTGPPPPGFTNSRVPPKSIFFPQTETMMEFEKDGTGHRFVGAREPERAARKILLLGGRPCDVRAATFLDRLFTWDYIDPYYVDKRERATVISFTCTGPMPNEQCFCPSMDGSPSGTEGADMLWTDLGDSYYVEALTPKGEAILSAGGDAFGKAGKKDAGAAKEVKAAADERITRRFDREGVAAALECLFDDPYWDTVSEPCLGCGICTLLCPTCHCFDINDVVRKGEGRRERTWDTCQAAYYSLHASGHNPRPGKKHRQRNRLYHKFLYIDRNLGIVGCVGCGRCIANCPVNIDIIEVAEGTKTCAEARREGAGADAKGAA
ncbi:MAG: 4Fe-4S dicluster domain-containing protein [Thermoplasmata archaeon]|nr:4Fe-4S dicluster domain-containing protein [Thermoplasmata archaeon]